MAQGPPVPTYIFRGHASPIHALHFWAENTFLVSGDSDGWLIVWSLATKRPVIVWKGHEGGIMSLEDWDSHKLISHGRDHKLRVWQLKPDDFEGMNVLLPVDGAAAEQSKQPWLLHSTSINALNYCSFSICQDNNANISAEHTSSRPLLLAAPNGLDAGGIDIFQLPSERRVCKMPSEKEPQTGMVMALSLFTHPRTHVLMLASGYESGHMLMFSKRNNAEQSWEWIRVMVTQPHSQPVLSLSSTPDGTAAFSSSADAVIIKLDVESNAISKRLDTKHAGQQDLKVRDDSKIFATAGWDKRVRVYSVKTMKELAVLKWHQEGCYATAFAKTVLTNNDSIVRAAENTLIKTAVDMLRNEQATKAQKVHWLAAGGKDAKISLWDIY